MPSSKQVETLSPARAEGQPHGLSTVAANARARDTLESRLAEVEDRLAIRELISRYCFSIDDHDLQAVGDLFTEDASFSSLDGVMSAKGRAAIVKQFEGRFSALGAGHHFSHDQVVEFESETRARGRVSLHAELWRNGKTMITALRYADIYEKQAGKWRFAERVISYMYYLSVDEYATAMGQLDRNRAYGKPMPADWPENLPSWVDYRAKSA